MVESNEKRIAIIGAGVSGLASVKECLDNKLIPICFEQNSFIGGHWKTEEKNEYNQNFYSAIYKNLITNTSKEMTAYSDFPMPAEWPTFLDCPLVEKYIEMYAKKFNLSPHIKLNTKVINISMLDDKRWKIKYITQDQNNKNDKNNITQNEEKEEIFDYVMVCNGHHHNPQFPKFKGMDKFKGEQIHSRSYNDPEDFKNKRVLIVGGGHSGLDIAVQLSSVTSRVYLSLRSDFKNKRVLIVGGGHSGLDIAVQLSSVTSRVYLSLRSGRLPWIVPRHLKGKPLDHYSRFIIYAIPLKIRQKLISKAILDTFDPLPSYLENSKPIDPIFTTTSLSINNGIFKCIRDGSVIVKPNIRELKSKEDEESNQGNNQVEFVDESIIEDIDIIIYATGYKLGFPFLDKSIITGGDKIEQEYGEKYQENLVWLYKRIFPVNHPNIAIIGLVFGAEAFLPLGEMQARYVVNQIKGLINPLPPPHEMDKSIRQYYKKNEQIYFDPEHHTFHAPALLYLDELSKEIGCYPYPWEIIKKFGFMFYWKFIIFGMATPHQHRLLGRNSLSRAKEVNKILENAKEKHGICSGG
ncbi:hypothetical protein Glove_461g51 [Diversispora epigaea]|uniref:Flavin-containing monooxygenase n=1 Tax=Diversispora epigaea TaxID=1348612 RepID=A0A397GNH4_9GLOM|nr:hypothetical protein Glove_461g51 [Diversispora epigaea]